MAECECELEARNREQAKTLKILLAINAFMFVVEFGAGMFGDSTALLADSLDMLADASVYAIGLYAVGKGVAAKAKAAGLNGTLQVLLGFGVLFDVLRRYFGESEPASLVMIAVGGLALAANVACLALISKHRSGDVNMRASWICSRSDVIANFGVILAGGFVAALGSRLPDLIIGFIIAAIVVKGGLSILRETRLAMREQTT